MDKDHLLDILYVGRYLILDGYESIQESSTDEDYICPVSSNQCTFSDQQAKSNSASATERLSEPIPKLVEPTPPSETFERMFHYIKNIETDLEQLKVSTETDL